MQSVTLIILSVLLGVVGQLVLKAAISQIGPLSVGDGGALGAFWRIVPNVGIWAGLCVYGIGTFFWLVALSQVELGYAYPFISLSYVLILLASWALFRERVSWWRLLGVAAICIGVYVVAAG
jgi:drug/metabolite transporter (DMT)-like permease